MSAKLLNQLSGMPQMGAAFLGWQNSITLQKVTQNVVDGLTVDTLTSHKFQGVIQPLSAKQIALKPEGERAWSWFMIHVFAGTLDLTTSDKILIKGVAYKVMGVWDYSLNNYVEYHVIKDFVNG